MIFARKKAEMTDAARALPGRSSAIATASTHFVNGNPLKGPYPKGAEQIVVAMGCYWGAERKFWELPRLGDAVGNAGGSRQPTMGGLFRDDGAYGIGAGGF